MTTTSTATTSSPVLACPGCDKPMPRGTEATNAPTDPDDLARINVDGMFDYEAGEELVFDSWDCPNKPCHYRSAKLRRPTDPIEHPTHFAHKCGWSRDEWRAHNIPVGVNECGGTTEEVALRVIE